MDNILQARSEGSNDEFEAHTLSISVADIPGVLNHVRPQGLCQQHHPVSLLLTAHTPCLLASSG